MAGRQTGRDNAAMHTLPRPCLPRAALAGAAGAAGAALLLAGCSVVPLGPQGQPGTDEAPARAAPAPTQRVVPLTLAPAPRPTLRPGDTFFYGRSTVLRLLSVQGGQQHWSRTTAPTELHSTGDFFAPPLRTSSPGQTTESTLEGRPGDLWPLAPGKSVRFAERRQITWTALRLSRSVRYEWHCEVVDARMSYVPAGDHETFHVRCEGRSDSLLFPTERLSWDYAPLVGHEVRRTWFAGGRERVATLSAALPGSVANEERIASVLRRLATQR